MVTEPTNSKQIAAYKSIRIDPNNLKPNGNALKLSNRVSFDTISIQYSNDVHDMDDDCDSEDDLDVEDLETDVTPHSFKFKNMDIDRTTSLNPIFDKNGWRIDYPSKPIINDDSLAMVFATTDYITFTEENGERGLLIYITGRQHTWVSIDYVVDKFLQNGDHLIIVSRVPGPRHHIESSKFKRVAKDLKDYVNFLLTNNPLTLKLTIDLFISNSTTEILKNCLQIYQPNFIITSTKPNLKFERQHSWKTSKISDRLVKNFHIPVVIIPSFTLNEFEIQLFKKLTTKNSLNLEELRKFDKKFELLPTIDITNIDNADNADNKSSSSDDDDESINSAGSDSSDTYKTLSRTVTNYHDMLSSFITDIESDPIDEDIFLLKLNKITDITYKIDLKFKKVSTEGNEGANLVRSLTGLPALEMRKSMLDVLDVKPAPSKSSSTENDSKEIHLSPRRIKFTQTNSDHLKKETYELRKSKSHIEPRLNHTFSADSSTLAPIISQPQPQPHLQKQTKPEKKGFFSKLFKKKK